MSSETVIDPQYKIPEDPMVSQPCWCGCLESERVSTSDRWGQKLDTKSCTSCGAIRQEPRMTQEQCKKFYQNVYEDTHQPEIYFERQRNWNTDVYLEPFVDKGIKVLDSDCGPGGKLSPLIEKGREIYAYDLNLNFVNFAVSKGLKRWNPEEKYDCIFLSHTLEHWCEPYIDLKEIFDRQRACYYGSPLG